MTGSMPGGRAGCSELGAAGHFFHVRPDDRGVDVFGEGHPAGQALIQHTSQRVDVGPAIDWAAPDLLGGDVVDGAHELTGRGQPTARGGMLADAKIAQVDVIGLVVVIGAVLDQDVARLDVAVHQPVPVRGIQRPARLADQQQRLIGREHLLGLEHRAQSPRRRHNASR